MLFRYDVFMFFLGFGAGISSAFRAVFSSFKKTTKRTRWRFGFGAGISSAFRAVFSSFKRTTKRTRWRPGSRPGWGLFLYPPPAGKVLMFAPKKVIRYDILVSLHYKQGIRSFFGRIRPE